MEETKNKIDFSNYILLKKLKESERVRAYKFIKMGLLTKEKTPQGFAVDKTELAKQVSKTMIGSKLERGGFQIDLSSPSRLNCLYKRFADMNAKNKIACQNGKLPRYVDEKGFLCINLKDYIKPQVELIAKKLECKPIEVYNNMFELIQKINKHNYEEE